MIVFIENKIINYNYFYYLQWNKTQNFGIYINMYKVALEIVDIINSWHNIA